MIDTMASDEPRRLPAPWTPVEIPDGWRIDDAEGKFLCYVYAHDDGREWQQLTAEEARRVASNIARLPELLAKDKT